MVGELDISRNDEYSKVERIDTWDNYNSSQEAFGWTNSADRDKHNKNIDEANQVWRIKHPENIKDPKLKVLLVDLIPKMLIMSEQPGLGIKSIGNITAGQSNHGDFVESGVRLSFLDLLGDGGLEFGLYSMDITARWYRCRTSGMLTAHTYEWGAYKADVSKLRVYFPGSIVSGLGKNPKLTEKAAEADWDI